MNNEIVFNAIKETLTAEFHLDPDSIGLEKRLSEDLDLDSLDELELLTSLKDHIGEKVDPSLFDNVHTVQDAVSALEPLWKRPPKML